EYHVLEGEMTYGHQKIGKGAYVYAPKGVPVEAMTFSEGSQILHYREYGDAGFDAVDSVAAPRWADAREDVIVIDTEAMTFDAVPNPGPMPGLFIKYLHVDPVSGFYTRLVYAQEGWTDHRLAHHPCYEEAYTTQGKMSYNFGDLDPGAYFFRPARIKHGHFTALEGGTTWLFRSDGELMNWYTQNEFVRWGGEGVNYAPDGGRLTWSMSSNDIAGGRTWRSDKDIENLEKSVAYQRSLNQPDVDYVQHGTGPDRSLIALAKAMDAARLQAGHGHDHDHGEPHTHPYADYGWPEPSSLEHPDERTDEHSHDWGVGRAWKKGDRIPAPILSSLPVRSRSIGRWDGDGM
ncbi:MAG: DUF4437 domain-containing protein, partial [Candidatus Nanopelagicales bacterium]